MVFWRSILASFARNYKHFFWGGASECFFYTLGVENLDQNLYRLKYMCPDSRNLELTYYVCYAQKNGETFVSCICQLSVNSVKNSLVSSFMYLTKWRCFCWGIPCLASDWGGMWNAHAKIVADSVIWWSVLRKTVDQMRQQQRQKSLQQHKKRADWKQKRYQVRRVNTVTSLNDAWLRASNVNFTQSVVPIKNDMSEEGFFVSNDKSKIVENCQCDVKWTMQSLQSVDSYSELLKEIPETVWKLGKINYPWRKLWNHIT